MNEFRYSFFEYIKLEINQPLKGAITNCISLQSLFFLACDYRVKSNFHKPRLYNTLEN